ncbi:MAG: phosphoribosylformylglycinamidine synthase subunit PurQ [archaeon]
MKVNDIKVAVMVMEGTNNEAATSDAFSMLGARPEIVHINQFLKKDITHDMKRKIDDYQCIVFPGGFSAGDYVRAGAIWAARLKAGLKDDIVRFVREGYPVGGICNGFQVIVELGLLPGGKEIVPDYPDAVLRQNASSHFECRHVLLKHVSKGKCAWTKNIPKGAVLEMPVAHGEGNFTLPLEQKDEILRELVANDQIVFRYVDDEGNFNEDYPWNPNGSLFNIAGISNPEGNVFGMMPHPERVISKYTLQRWYGGETRSEDGPGVAVFSSVLDHIKRRF